MEDSVCYHEKNLMLAVNKPYEFLQQKHTEKNCKRFQIAIACRFGSSCEYLNLDHTVQGNKTITNKIQVEEENLEISTKEGIHLLKASVKHISENITGPY